ncbi:MAG TPA: D-alanine--D-alanine ligase [Bacillota bacterium]|jgi:D-alanine-D-alanine ligase|nr:D-alanine--D-alanine ligase [Bacillota bacterium]
MSLNKHTAVVLYNKILKTSPEDVIDNRTQAEWISEELEELGFNVIKMQFEADCISILENYKKTNKNLIVINLVDSAPGEESLAYLVPAILDYIKIKYTGCSHEALFLTTNKVYTKKILHSNFINTPEWICGKENCGFSPNNKYIIKALCEDASVGLCDESVFMAKSLEELTRSVISRENKEGKPFFAERYIEGREFNVCIYGDQSNPIILPPYEWTFDRFEEKGKVKIINYDAKWTENTYEYDHVNAVYDLPKEDNCMLEELKAVSKACWEIFKLKGYARVDFRADLEGNLWVLEINCNPSFYGFYNIAKNKGLNFKEILRRIVEAV